MKFTDKMRGVGGAIFQSLMGTSRPDAGSHLDHVKRTIAPGGPWFAEYNSVMTTADELNAIDRQAVRRNLYPCHGGEILQGRVSHDEDKPGPQQTVENNRGPFHGPVDRAGARRAAGLRMVARPARIDDAGGQCLRSRSDGNPASRQGKRWRKAPRRQKFPRRSKGPRRLQGRPPPRSRPALFRQTCTPPPQ